MMTKKKQAKAGKKLQGFAAISAERRQEIARMGGKASNKSGKAHRWNRQEASQHGKKGGQKSAALRRAAMKARKLAG
jgi:general stress protein YciG